VRRQYLLDNGRPDKHTVEGRRVVSRGGEKRQIQRCLEAFRLAAEVITIHPDINTPDKLLSTFFGAIRGFGKENKAGAGAPCRSSLYPGKPSVLKKCRWSAWRKVLDEFS
jgi:hypothetical protein